MSLVTRLATRAALPGLGAGLANTKPTQSSGGRGGVKAATRNVSYQAPGQPMQSYDSPRGIYSYFASVWVMRCVRTIAQTIAGLPFRAGMDMDTPSNFVPDAPLARLLGPATTQAPGGPNPFTSSRDLWTWTIVQYVLTGKIGWELQTDGPGSKGNVAALWPLVSEFLNPIPTEGTSQFFSGFEYVVGGGERIRLSTDQVFYAWRPSARDWRKPESVLDSAKDVVGVQVALDRYYANLLKNNLYSPVIVKTPPFEEPEEARAFQESFTQEFTGFDNAGKPIFVEYETDDNRASQGKDTGDIQVERLTQTSTDAGLQEIAQQAKIDVTVALGVPESLIGNASQRCADEDTEALTQRGWLRGDEITTKDTILSMDPTDGRLKWSPIHEVYRNPHYDGPMWRLRHNHMDALVTPGHKWAVKPRPGQGRRSLSTTDACELKKVEELSTHDRIVAMGAPEASNVEATFSSAFVELVGWAVTEGWFPTKRYNYIRISQNEGPNADRIRACLKETQSRWCEGHATGRRIVRFDVRGEIREALHRVAPGKIMTTEFLLALTAEQRELLVQTMIDADGHRPGGTTSWTFGQKSAEASEAFVLLATLAGYRTSTRIRHWSDGQEFLTIVGQRKVMTVQRQTLSTEPYEGAVWCPRTDYGTMVARRHGRVFVTGQTYANADAELRNAWTITFLPLILELQDKINVGLAPRIGKEVGWWDVSDVAALQPPAVIAQPSIPDLVQNGVATPAQIADLLDLPGSADQGETANEASAMSGAAEAPALSMLKISGGVAGGSRADSTAIEVRSKVAELRGARRERERRQVNEFGSTGPGPNLPIGNNYDPTNSGMLAPVGEKHAFKGRNLMACATCGQPRSSPIHTRPERRHAGKPGHQHVVGGHAKSARRVDAEKAAWLTDVNAAEGPLTDALKSLFADQRKATISRLTGKRGRQMLKALERRQNEPPNTTAASTPPAAVTSGTVFTAPFWIDKTATVVQPALGAIGTQAASRVRRQVGAPAVNDQGTLATMQAALQARAQRLAQYVTQTTANQITQALSEGVSNGEGIDALTARVNKIFDNADRARAQTIARTEVVGAANQAATDYATNLPPGIVGKKRWLAHHDDRTRPDHRMTDGQERPIQANYSVGVAGHPAMFPGDPRLPIDELAGCRCGQMFLPGESASATGVAS